MQNAAPNLSETSYAWSSFKNIQATEVVEGTCSSLEADNETPDPLLSQFEIMGIGVSQGPWTLVCFFTDNVLGEDFDLDRFLSKSGIMIHMVPHIVEHKHSGSYELVVATPYLDLLLERVQGHGFKLVVNHDPFKPAEEDVRIHGMWEAKRRARVNTLSNAADAIRNGWGYGPAECYRSVIAKAGLGTELERTILNWDIQHSNSRILQHFTQNLLFLCLNCCDGYDSPSALDVLGRDQAEWLQPFEMGHTALFEILMATDVPYRVRDGLERQTTSLFRSLLESSGGRVELRQHDFGVDHTVSQNASLCAKLLGISCTRQFGRFDPKEMQNALSKSKLLAELSKPSAPDTVEWKSLMMVQVPIGFPDNYLNLPSQLLYGFGARQVDQIRTRIEQTYRQLPSLRKDENNILVLMVWSSTYQGQTLEVLSDWIKSVESSNLFQVLTKGLWLQQTPEEFALSLSALLCRERLLPYTMGYTTLPIRGSYLADFDDILNGYDLRNRRTVFEQIVMSLMRVLSTFNVSDETARFLAAVLDKEVPLLEPLDGVADQYCANKVYGHNHNAAFEGATEGLKKCVEAMLSGDGNADSEWTVIPSSSLQLVSAS